MKRPAVESAERIRVLLALYRESHYDVSLPHRATATIRVGEPAPQPLRAWIGSAGIAFYLTACNPRSRSLPAAENERRLEVLRTQLHEHGIAFLDGAGHMPGASWREPSLLVRGVTNRDVADLVREHDQNAVVVVRATAPATLRIYRPDWRAVVGDSPDIEWAGRGPAPTRTPIAKA